MSTLRYFISVIFIFSVCFTYAQQAQWDWAKHAGGVGDDSGYSITNSRNGNQILVGQFNGTAMFDNISLSNIDIYGGSFITAIDSMGNFQWASRMVGTNSSYFHSIATDIYNNIYAAGSFSETIYLDSLSFTSIGSADIIIAKYNSAGILQWAKSAGGIGLDGATSVICSDSLLFVGGEYRDSVYFDSTSFISNGNSDILLACLDLDGNYRWIKSAGGEFYDVSRSISLDNNSNIILAGHINTIASFGYTDTTVNTYGSADPYVAKYTPDGGFLWVNSFGSISGDRGISVSSDHAGNIFLQGHFYGTSYFEGITLISNGDSDYFVCKLSPTGDVTWARNFGATVYPMDDVWKNTLVCDNSGNAYITGWFMDSLVYDDLVIQSTGSYDIFVMKIDGNGDLVWSLTAGNDHSYGDYSRSICRDSTGNLYITGRFYDTLFFGDSSVTSYGSADVFIAKIKEDPVSINYNEIAATIDITVYPNPTDNYLNIFSIESDLQFASLLTIEGKEIATFNISNQY